MQSRRRCSQANGESGGRSLWNVPPGLGLRGWSREWHGPTFTVTFKGTWNALTITASQVLFPLRLYTLYSIRRYKEVLEVFFFFFFFWVSIKSLMSLTWFMGFILMPLYCFHCTHSGPLVTALASKNLTNENPDWSQTVSSSNFLWRLSRSFRALKKKTDNGKFECMKCVCRCESAMLSSRSSALKGAVIDL